MPDQLSFIILPTNILLPPFLQIPFVDNFLTGKEPEIVNSPIMRNSRSLCLTGSKNQNAIDCRCKTNEMSNHIR